MTRIRLESVNPAHKPAAPDPMMRTSVDRGEVVVSRIAGDVFMFAKKMRCVKIKRIIKDVSMILNNFSALFADFYQFTMAQGYWQRGMADHRAVFNLYFRCNPFHGDFAVACGLHYVIDALKNYRFTDADIASLRAQSQPETGHPLFLDDFLDYLGQLSFACDIDAVEEGEWILAKEPLLRVTGPLLQCVLLESLLINLMNYSTLVATKAARVRLAAGDDYVIDFGLRRAQSLDVAVMATRAAYLVGIDASSNVWAASQHNIPLRGTMSHSWVLAFQSELDSFDAYADCYPQCAVFLLDTFDTVQAVGKALIIGNQLREQGADLAGVRLDSGDLLALSKAVRRLLDEAGFQQTIIIASGDLEEGTISDLKAQGAPIDAWGVGTKLVTCHDQPYLNIVYKLGALQDNQGLWQYKLKRSDEKAKITMPGAHQVRRYMHNGFVVDDLIYDASLNNQPQSTKQHDDARDLLVPIFKSGVCVYDEPTLDEKRMMTVRRLQAYSRKTQPDWVPRFDEHLLRIQQQFLLKGDF